LSIVTLTLAWRIRVWIIFRSAPFAVEQRPERVAKRMPADALRDLRTQRSGTFALNGNHEMYADGNGYWKMVLPRMGLKEASSEEFVGKWRA